MNNHCMPTKSRGGKYCCIPQCTSSSSKGIKMFVIPGGRKRRHGLDTASWAESFHQVIYQYRDPCNNNLKQRILAQKVFICKKHFRSNDIIDSNHKSCLKFGSIPSCNLPGNPQTIAPSYRPPPLVKRTEIIPTEIPRTEIPPTEIRNNSVESIKNSFLLRAKFSKWRMHCIDKSALHFTYFSNPLHLHGTPDQSMVIYQKNDELNFSYAIHGQYVNALKHNMNDITIHRFLNKLEKYNLCDGYQVTGSTDKWQKIKILKFNSETNKTFASERFICTDCIIAVAKVGTCQQCVKQYVKEFDLKKRRESYLKKVMDKPVKKFAPTSSTSAERLSATILSLRKRIADLEKNAPSEVVDVDKHLANLLETTVQQNQNDAFLKEWWGSQVKLRKATFSCTLRYPPSVIRYCMKLYEQSPAAYSTLKDILVLPSTRRLRQEKKKLAESGNKDVEKKVAGSGIKDDEEEVAEAGIKDDEIEVAESGVKDDEKKVAESGIEDGEKEVTESGIEEGEKEVAESGIKDGGCQSPQPYYVCVLD